MKIAVVCASGIGDAVILHIVSHHLSLAGHEVITVTPHRFGKWLSSYQFGSGEDCEAVFLQHDNTVRSYQIQSESRPVYTFYGSYRSGKHPPLKNGFDYVCDPNETMATNAARALRLLFGIQSTLDNGFRPPLGSVHRRYHQRIAIHTGSQDPGRRWPIEKFNEVARQLASQGFAPCLLPSFPDLEQMISYIYESGYFLGNDSGPGHIASCLQVPSLIIGREEKHMRFWRPGWGLSEIITPPRWIPNWKGLRLRETEWKRFISVKNVIKKLKNNVLIN